MYVRHATVCPLPCSLLVVRSLCSLCALSRCRCRLCARAQPRFISKLVTTTSRQSSDRACKPFQRPVHTQPTHTSRIVKARQCCRSSSAVRVRFSFSVAIASGRAFCIAIAPHASARSTHTQSTQFFNPLFQRSPKEKTNNNDNKTNNNNITKKHTQTPPKQTTQQKRHARFYWYRCDFSYESFE